MASCDMASKKEVAELRRLALGLGLTVSYTASHHMVVADRSGRTILISGTPGSDGAIKRFHSNILKLARGEPITRDVVRRSYSSC